MFPGWETELRSNRWHYATRWARHLPVVLLQPDLDQVTVRPPSALEGRIPNCRVLHIQSVGDPLDMCATSAVQAAQVLDHMSAYGHERPILWFYNPNLAGLYARLTAAARVYHATENYFHFQGLDDWFISQMRAAFRMSDLTVSVSDGVAASITENVPTARPPLVISNGCDYRHYSHARPDRDLRARARPFKRVATYAGNINSRLDFDLLTEVAGSQPDTFFAIYGPVGNLTSEDVEAWARLQERPNVRHLGPIDPDRIRDVYAASDLGLIPYKHDHWLIENGFPLKALEMAATGLPVVSSWMRPIENLAAGMIVTRTAADFAAAVAQVSRSTLPDEAIESLTKVSAANDYDAKFEAVLSALASSTDGQTPSTALDVLIAESGEHWREGERRLLHRIAGTPLQIVASPSPGPAKAPRPPLRTRLFIYFADRVSEGTRKALPEPIRLSVKRWFGLPGSPEH